MVKTSVCKRGSKRVSMCFYTQIHIHIYIYRVDRALIVELLRFTVLQYLYKLHGVLTAGFLSFRKEFSDFNRSADSCSLIPGRRESNTYIFRGRPILRRRWKSLPVGRDLGVASSSGAWGRGLGMWGAFGFRCW